MIEENLNSGISTTEGQTVEGTAQNPTPVSNQETTFTKERVNELMRKRIDKSHQAFFKRYGVKDLKELDGLFSKAGGYDNLKAENEEGAKKYSDLENQYQDLTKRYGYKSCNIDEKKIQDIETYFKGKGLNISEETLREELKTHPDWVNKVSTIQQIGAEVKMPSEADERAEASRIFGVKL